MKPKNIGKENHFEDLLLRHDVSKEKLPSSLGLKCPLNMKSVLCLLYPKYGGSTRSAVP